MSFLSKEDLKNPAVQKAIGALKALIQTKTDKDGEEYQEYGTVERVYATVVAEHKFDLFLKKNDVKLDERLGRHALMLVGMKLPGVEELRRAPGSDHTRLFLKDKRPHIFTSEPYGLGWDDLKEIVAYCKEHGLEASVDAWDSWHFPGCTLLLQYRKAPTKH